METGKKRKALPERECACGVRFTPNTTWQKFHSRECRDDDWDSKNRRVNAEKPASYEWLIKMVQEAEPDSGLFREMQKAVYSKVQRQTPHGPGKKKKKRKA